MRNKKLAAKLDADVNKVVFPQKEDVRFSRMRGAVRELLRENVDVFAGAQGAFLFHEVDQGVDDLGSGAGGFPVVEVLVEEEPLHEAVATVVVGRELGERAQGEGVGLDGVVVPEPGAILGRPLITPPSEAGPPRGAQDPRPQRADAVVVGHTALLQHEGEHSSRIVRERRDPSAGIAPDDRGERAAIVLTGGNVDTDRFAAVLAGATPSR